MTEHTNNNRIYIFDTTLRDGQQSPGAGMSFADNLKYAEHAAALNVDILEAGFPAASSTDFAIVKAISEKMAAERSPMHIAALCQLREAQVITTMEALAASRAIGTARVHIYVPVDPNLMLASLGSLAEQPERIVELVHRLVKLVSDAGYEVEFSPEGYSRMRANFAFTTDVIRAAVSGGATIINCPDTIGGASRFEGEDYFVNNLQKHAAIMQQEFPQRNIIWSAHCHNDLGLALENSIHATFSGPVRQLEGCINGIGERAGNLALEQAIIFIDQFGARANPHNPFYTHCNLNHIKPISDFVAEKMLSRQPHAPIVGDNAACHTSGGHTNAILKNPTTYQPYDPGIVGHSISFVFGPLSGSNHAKQIIEKFGYRCDESKKVEITQAIKDVYADRRKGITDEELIKAYKKIRAPIIIERVSYARANDTANFTIDGKFFNKQAININYQGANSALAALCMAVEEYFPGAVIFDYHSNSCDGHTVNAKCHSVITINTADKRQYCGEALDADIEISALKAFIDAINQAYIDKHYRIEE